MLEIIPVAEQPATPATAMSPFAESIYRQKYAQDGENWTDTAHRVATNVMGALGYDPDSPETRKIERFIAERKFLPGGRYLYASGRELHQTQNCVLLRAEDSREGWSELMYKSAQSLMTGAGIGIVYSDIRQKGAIIHKTGGVASGPVSLASIINEIGRRVMQGGSRRSAIWAGLHWWHPDVFDFIKAKDWSKADRDRKAADFNFPCELDMTNISVILDRDFFDAYEDESHPLHQHAHKVYRMTVKQMVTKAEPGFSVDYDNPNECLRNACTEVTSEDDSDICNLGSINMARIESKEELAEVTEAATLFLLAGTVYSHVPYERIDEVRQMNRRLGLGLMGLHEWLLLRGYKYGPCDELAEWLAVWRDESRRAATAYANHHGLSVPKKVRAIAPTGTIGIIAETTTGIEPIYALAFKRRYIVDGDRWHYQYVVDPTAHRLVEDYGVDPRTIEDAYTLAYDVERRVAFQHFVQQYVDHGISSTINLYAPLRDKQEQQEFGDMLMKYLPGLRGITCYPDGARGGQPLSVATYEQAMKEPGKVFEESEEKCVGGACGA